MHTHTHRVHINKTTSFSNHTLMHVLPWELFKPKLLDIQLNRHKLIQIKETSHLKAVWVYLKNADLL